MADAFAVLVASAASSAARVRRICSASSVSDELPGAVIPAEFTADANCALLSVMTTSSVVVFSVSDFSGSDGVVSASVFVVSVVGVLFAFAELVIFAAIVGIRDAILTRGAVRRDAVPR